MYKTIKAGADPIDPLFLQTIYLTPRWKPRKARSNFVMDITPWFGSKKFLDAFGGDDTR